MMELHVGVDTNRPSLLPNDLPLLDGVRRLDPQALSEVHNKYYPAIFRFIAFKVGDRETAEDLTSDVFVRLLDAVRDRHAPHKTLRGWLYSVASHIVIDYYRKQYRSRQEVELTDMMVGPGASPAERAMKKQTLESLHQALSQLTDDQRNVISLRFGYDLPIKDVAHMLGKSEGSVKQLQARAVASLARLMTKETC
jgi:RNA polymerase sigma-70 factor (ECF subfamily)